MGESKIETKLAGKDSTAIDSESEANPKSKIQGAETQGSSETAGAASAAQWRGGRSAPGAAPRARRSGAAEGALRGGRARRARRGERRARKY